MIQIIFFTMSSIMEGTVDQIEGNKAVVELTAKDGHIHQEIFPTWVFPCRIEEGSRFSVKSNEKNTIITCNKK